MALRSPQHKKPKICPVQMAVAAVEHDGSVMDLPVEGFDPSPTALDLPEQEGGQPCSRCGSPAWDTCPTCGSPACEDCVAGDKC
jgi:hypothetical protein